MSEVQRLPITSLIRDEQYQPRVQEHADHVWGMVLALKRDPKVFDAYPVHAWRVEGELILVDGFHRMTALRSQDVKTVNVIIHESERPMGMSDEDFAALQKADALRKAISANNHFGSPLKRSMADNRRAVTLLLSDPMTRKLSNRQIAELVGCTSPTVAAVRRENDEFASTERLGADGKVYQPAPAAPAKPKAQQPVATAPDAPEQPEQPKAQQEAQPAPAAQTAPEQPKAQQEVQADLVADLDRTKLENMDLLLQIVQLTDENAALKSKVADLEAQLAKLKPKAQAKPKAPAKQADRLPKINMKVNGFQG